MKKAIVSSIPIRQGVRYSDVKTKKSLTRPTAIPISPLKKKTSKIPVTTPVKTSNHTKNRTVKGVKIPTPVSAKRKNEDATTGRNVRKRLVDNHDDHNVVLSESRLENAVLIADNTSLELEEERLKKEYNAKFAEIFQLEHVLACEQSDAAQLFDLLENKRSEYFLLVKEKDDLIKSQATFEELNNDSEKKIDELDKLLFTCDTQLKDITKLFEEKVQANAILRSTVDELKKKKKYRRYKK